MQCDTYKLTREVYTEFFVVVVVIFFGGGGYSRGQTIGNWYIHISTMYICIHASKYMLKIFKRTPPPSKIILG